MSEIRQIQNIKISDFALRHFDPKFGGTKILNMEPKEFEEILNEELMVYNSSLDPDGGDSDVVKILNGYAPFCKLIAVKNFTDARVGSMPITIANHQYIRHGYSKRRESEFEVFSRWLELPVPAPKANYLMIIAYNQEQMDKEAIADYNKKMAEGGIDSIGLEKPEPFPAEWGVVAILGQHGPDEEPMKPETFDRNYMPIEFGGSGMKYPVMPIEPNRFEFEGDFDYMKALDIYKKLVAKYKTEIDEIRAKRKKCVYFWQNNVTVR